MIKQGGLDTAEGKIQAVKYARLNNVPFFGIGLGMQCAVLEYVKDVLGYVDADSTEMNARAEYNIFDLMQEQKERLMLDDTMRIGAFDCELKDGSKVKDIYKCGKVSERHRHRFEFNNKYKEELENAGMVCSGINPQSGFVEVVELPNHKWFVGTQFHPEYNSSVLNPHPLFMDFVRAAVDNSSAKAE